MPVTADFHEESAEKIYIRENGQTRAISREEWGERFPHREPVVVKSFDVVENQATDKEVFSANITHNLSGMAGEANIYECLWCPDENGITQAGQLIEPLASGLAMMQSNPEQFIKLNPANGWGSYKDFLPWIARLLEACAKYPHADIHTSR